MVFIALQVLLLVRYRWTETQMRRLEKAYYFIAIFCPSATALVLVFLKAMNPTANGYCWICANPYNCNGGRLDPLCQEQDNGRIDTNQELLITFIAATIPIGLTFALLVVRMVMLFLTVRSQEKRAERWSDHAAEGRQQKRVIRKTFQYIGAFVLVWLPTLLRNTGLSSDASYNDIIVNMFLPLQGLLNALIYSDFLWNRGKESTKNVSEYFAKTVSFSISGWLARLYKYPIEDETAKNLEGGNSNEEPSSSMLASGDMDTKQFCKPYDELGEARSVELQFQACSGDSNFESEATIHA